uniref:Uncharacterized LOC107719123 n=1 Tax=Sinocyclocheilus rhinocerous TaxID=307959 RepID=A0A673MG49_9TELE
MYKLSIYLYKNLLATRNLALYGKATQSDLVENPWSADGLASNAIDGNHDSHYDHGSCTATTMQNDPWWRLDLLDKYVVTSITITNRKDCCPERLDGAEIHIGNSLLNNGNSNPLAGKISSIPGGRSLTFKWKKGIPGRYINVVIPGSNRLLTLCEVEVYGYPAPDGENMNIYDRQNIIYFVPRLKDKFFIQNHEFTWNSSVVLGENVALNGKATQKTVLENGFASNANKVFSVVITNREDSFSERLNGAEIRIGNSLDNKGNNNPRCAVISSIHPGFSSTFECDGMEGRYINVVIPGRQEYLTLCEVEVYGSPLD